MTAIRNHHGRVEGLIFESRLKHQAAAERIALIQLPTGARPIGSVGKRPRLIPVKTPFDFVLAKDRRAAFIDAKSTAKSTFPYADVTDHQVAKLFELESQRFPAGYLVHFRQSGEVVFFRASELLALRPRMSLSPTDGLCIGTINVMSLVSLFDWGIG